MRLLLLPFSLCFALGTQAASFAVTSTADSGAGSLRQAVIDANATASPPHTIGFAAGYPLDGVISLQSALPILLQSTTISGGTRRPIVDGMQQHAILRIGSNITVNIDRLRLRNGLRSAGACIGLASIGSAASLFVSDSSFENCAARAGSNPGGGAIGWQTNGGGLLSVSGSTFTGNLAQSSTIGNEQPRGGAIESYSVTLLYGNTFESNYVAAAGSDGGFGGAIYLSVPGGSFVSEVTSNRFRFNSVTPIADNFGLGGALYAGLDDGGQLDVARNWFRGNSARSGGGVATSANAGVTASTRLRNNSFYNHSTLQRGGGVLLQRVQATLEHNSFFNNDGGDGAHLSLSQMALTRFVNNVMAATFSGNACVLDNVDLTALQRAGNHHHAVCATLSDDGVINAAMSAPSVDESQRVGVLAFDADDGPIDGGSGADCLAEDARASPRPNDGDGDGAAECDAGAFEHRAARVFADGFE